MVMCQSWDCCSRDRHIRYRLPTRAQSSREFVEVERERESESSMLDACQACAFVIVNLM